MDNRGLLTLLVVLILIILVGALLGGMMGPGMMWGMGPGMMWGYGGSATAPTTGGWAWGLGMALGMLATLAFWGALIVGIVLLVRWAFAQIPGGPGRVGTDDALAILRRRYAAGEIDQATYERMKRELEA
jgi:putative membrane protein